MKKVIIISTVLLVFFNCRTLAQSEPTVKTILDSLEVLKKVGGLVDGYTNPPTAEETRLHNITMMLFALPYGETKKLLNDKNKFARVYGFTVATKHYFDSLTKLDLKLFSDTAKLPLYTQRGIIDAGITVGQYCEMAYTSTIEEQETAAKEKDVIASIKHFIKINSQYPNSYEPIEFSYYSWGGDDKDLFFEIQHKYKLKQTDGKLVDATNYFILDGSFNIMLIETVRSKTVRVNPPELDEWRIKFGKAK
jgi:hypothetical protein